MRTISDTAPVRMVFRKWHNGDVIALMPDIPTDKYGHYCQSFEHVGQHGAADYHGCVCLTAPAKPHEYAKLKRELEGRGYVVKVTVRR